MNPEDQLFIKHLGFAPKTVAPRTGWDRRKEQLLALNTGPPPAPKQRDKGGLLSSLISELGGAGGAAGGAALGSAVLPGIGTIIGAGLGGFLGGTGGRLAENKVRDNEFRPGQALGEGALAGALSVAGGAFQAAKAAKGAKALSGVAKGATVSPTTTMGILETKGLGLTSKTGGYHIGAPLPGPGAKGLSASQVKFYDSLLRKQKIPANDASDLAKGVEGRLSQVGEILNTNLAKNNIAIKDAKSLAKDLVSQVKSKGGLNQSAVKYAEEQATKLSKIKDAKGLLQFKRELDSSINFAQNPDLATSQAQGALDVMRKGVKNRLNNLVPGLAEQNNLYHNLSNIQAYALKASNRGALQSTNAGGGIAGRLMTSPSANTLKAKAGSKLQTAGEFLTGQGGIPSKVAQQAKIQAPGNLYQALSNQVEPPQAALDPAIEPIDPLAAPQEQPPDDNGLSQALQQAMLDDLQTTGGKHVAAIKSVLETMGEGEGPNVTKVTGQQYGLAQTGMQSLQQLSSLLKSNPGVLSKTATPGRKLPIVGGYIAKAAGTGDFDAYGYNVADTLLRLRTGAQANESEVRNLQSQIIPRAGDSPATVQTKLRQLQQAFQNTLQQANGRGSSSSLQDALAAGF